MQRRELIQWLLATVATDDLFAVGREVHRRAVPSVDATLAAAAERILPGATQAGVPAFIEKMLADWVTPEERAAILAGLAGLSDVSQLESVDRANPDWYERFKFLTVYGYCTSEVGMRELGLWPQPWRYDGCAPVAG